MDINAYNLNEGFFYKQKTILQKITVQGVGLHSGKKVNLTITPTPSNSGIVFKRSDIDNDFESLIPAKWNLVTDATMCTKITNQFGNSVSTIEHLMAAFMGAGITNALVTLDAEEVPIMDGSSVVFSNLIFQSGLLEQETIWKKIKILKEIKVESDRGWASLSPFDYLKINVDFDFNGKLSDKFPKNYFFDWQKHDFAQMLSSARTFGMYEDAKKLQSMGFAKGASLDNAIVIDKDIVMNKEGLRFEDELVRHKVLDVIGDLSLAQGMIEGYFQGFNTGHYLNNQLLRKLFSDSTSYSLSS
jgi:UDP-3-O-[3-hydroxymyristoyl] N-acetylglucosamine deacetylase